jgi:oligoribonuclease NrnB/cAMP/cGMP phosphodiesterase (DHH superfamily)
MHQRKIAVFYHHPCSDGFGAAWAFWKKYGDSADCIPIGHMDLEKLDIKDLNDRYYEIFFVDIGPPAKQFDIFIREFSGELTVIDHHKTLIEDYGDRARDPSCYFDQNHSGAVLAWKYCFPSQPVPLLLRLIEDRDLWRWQIPDSAAYLAMLELSGYDFRAWDEFAYDLEDQYQNYVILGFGRTIVRHEKARQSRMLKQKHYIKIANTIVPSINSNVFASDLASTMATDAPFAAVYYRDLNSWYISLRSDSNNPQALDVSEIAKTYGGGGHKHAAAFRINDIQELFYAPTS